jgi:S-sulfo-L-cysteine synthase (O-acetyl-L-serine-dependent)
VEEPGRLREGPAGASDDGSRASASGALTRDKIILDATSGNTGIAYAMIGAARGYRVRLCVPENVTPERKRILKAFGAEIVFTDPMEGSDGAILRARAMYAERPDLYFYPDQYNNPANWRRITTPPAPEIFEQTGGRSRTSWPGSARAARSSARAGVCASSSPGPADLGAARLAAARPRRAQAHGHGHRAWHLRSALADEDIRVGTEEAFELTRRLARQGLFVGISSGANLAGALRVAASASDAVIVVVFCDGGEKYLSERFWDEGRRKAREEPPDGAAARTSGCARTTPSAQHGAETYPNECCGALYGRDGVVTDVYALPNTTEEGPRRRFLVRPGDYRAAEQQARGPAASCSGSTIRIRIIRRGRRSTISITRGRSSRTSSCPSRMVSRRDMTSWRLRDDRSAFDQEDLTYA